MTKLPYSSVAGPALAFAFNNRLFLACADRSTHQLRVIHGLEIGQYDARSVGSETTFGAPALAEHAGRLIIAWTGEDGGHHLNVMASSDGITWTDKRTLWTDFSNSGPSLVSYLGRLYLAYTGTDSHIYLLSSENGVDFDPGSRIRLSQTAYDSPAITARITQNGAPEFFLAWTGGGNKINYLECEGRDFGYLNTSTPGFGDTSPTGPVLASSFIDIVLLYRGYAGDHLYALGAGEGTIHLDPHRTVFADTSGFRPAIARTNNAAAWVAWTGQDGNQSVNVSGMGALATV
jgi:hypothetical protein